LDVGSQNRDAPQDESIRTKTKFIRQLFANEGGVTQFDFDSQTPYSHTSTFLLSRDVLVAGGVHSFEGSSRERRTRPSRGTLRTGTFSHTSARRPLGNGVCCRVIRTPHEDESNKAVTNFSLEVRLLSRKTLRHESGSCARPFSARFRSGVIPSVLRTIIAPVEDMALALSGRRSRWPGGFKLSLRRELCA